MRGLPIITVNATEVYDSHRDSERSRGPDETLTMRVMTDKICAFEVVDQSGTEYELRLWLDNGVVVHGTIEKNQTTARLISAWELR